MTVSDDADDTYYCDQCDEAVARQEAVRTETFAALDPDKWQVLCCPTCGRRLKTVFVGLEGGTR